jgi:hypothetical protein
VGKKKEQLKPNKNWVVISGDVHDRLKSLCKQRGWLIGVYVERAISEALAREGKS